jgi:hypothetical protein
MKINKINFINLVYSSMSSNLVKFFYSSSPLNSPMYFIEFSDDSLFRTRFRLVSAPYGMYLLQFFS